MKKKINLKNIIIFTIVFSALLFCISGVCAQDINTTDNIVDLNNNNDILKNPINDEENETLEIQNTDNLTTAGTFDDLQAEINKAPIDSILNLTKDYAGDGSRIQLSKDLTIDGQGHTLECLAFYSSCGKITLMNLKINGHNEKNYYNYNGGAICISDSAQYTLINCTFNNNWADDYGGAIYNDVNKPLTIINCSFNDNKVDDDDGGAIYSKGNVYIENSLFNSNHANEDGGAIFCCNDANITNCLFESNKANGAKSFQCEGGAIYCKGDLTVENSTFKNNYAEDYGGAIYAIY